MSFPVDRRAFLKTGLAAVGGLLAAGNQRSVAGMLRSMAVPPFSVPVSQTTPVLRIPNNGPVIQVGGVPFAPTWFGDDFAGGGFPFHTDESPRRWADLDEHVDIAIVGGGLSGMATAYELRDREWVLFDLRTRMGGVAQGERWSNIPYSLGSAYFMVPDDDSDEDLLYNELGVYDLAQIDRGGGFRLEYEDQILDEVCNGCTPREAAAIRAYSEAVSYYGNRAYPDIPWSDRDARLLVQSLDTSTFHQAVIDACGGEVPALLAKAIQAYCYSSFGVGWDELSAAAGWNFIAAEEFGRIVMPGGNSGLATLLWQKLRTLPGIISSHRPRLRAGCTVTDLNLVPEGVAVGWRDVNGNYHTLGAKRVVYAGSKHVFMHMMPQVEEIDPAKWDALHAVHTAPYVVANVLLKERVREEFYDLFYIHDAQFPMDGAAFEVDSRITDAVDGSFAVVSPHHNRDVLTLYWPLPWHTARFTLATPPSYVDYATRAAPQISQFLGVLGLSPNDISQVRMARWGHAMPFAPPGTYSNGLCPLLRQPLGTDRIWFASQDNWLLPAVETCLAEARWVATGIRAAS